MFLSYIVCDIFLIIYSVPDSDSITPDEGGSSMVVTSSPESTTMPTSASSSHSALSSGAVAGITVGVIAGAACLALILHRFIRNSNRGLYLHKSETYLSDSSRRGPQVFAPPTVRSIEQMSLVPTSGLQSSFTHLRRSSNISSSPPREVRDRVIQQQLGTTSKLAANRPLHSHANITSAMSIQDISDLHALLEQLEAQSQSMSTMALHAQITLLKTRLRSAMGRSISPPAD